VNEAGRQGLIVLRRISMLRLVEVYFAGDAEPTTERADLVVFLQATTKRGRSVAFETLHLSLAQDRGRLWRDLNKTTQYEIRRAESRDALRLSVLRHPSAGELTEFVDFYDRFATGVGIARCNLGKLTALRRPHALGISLGRASDGRTLCAHAYIVAAGRARLLYSATARSPRSDAEEASAIGRANRALHWADIRAFQEDGLSVYDLGGLAGEGASPRLQAIDRFKRGFGGREVVEFNCYVPKTLLGRVALVYLRRTMQPH